jgi:type I restriction enzyme, R subunit
MSPDISERSFEEAIEYELLQGGLAAGGDGGSGFGEAVMPSWGDMPSGGYLKRTPDDYDRDLGLLPGDVIGFVLATQPKERARLKQHHGAAVKERFVQRLAAEIKTRGALDVLRQGVRDRAASSASPISGRRAGSTRRQRGSTAPTCLRWCGSCATARKTRTASTSCCS